jgi:integrase
MPKFVAPLSLAIVNRIRAPGLHAVGGIAGLYLQVRETGARSWILRLTVGGKRRDMGLGSSAVVTLAQARQKALEARQQIQDGKDPLRERRNLAQQLAHAQAVPSFDTCAKLFLASKKVEFRNPKHAAQWEATLTAYASPVIGKMPVNEIDLPQILQVLEPIWTTKTETASRLRARIESVLAWATVAKYRSGDNPARWKGNLNAVLPKPGKVKQVKHHAALPFGELPGFMAELRNREGIAARMLEFTIMTAARSGEVRGAHWNEIDLDSATWTVPAGRMKGKKEHRVPLAAAAVDLLRAMPGDAAKRAGLIFANTKGTEFCDMALTAVLRRMNVPVATVHGMRSAFRDWAGETSSFPREVIEHGLAHKLKDKAEAAYARGTLFDKRRALMEAWARYLVRADVLVPIRRAPLDHAYRLSDENSTAHHSSPQQAAP